MKINKSYYSGSKLKTVDELAQALGQRPEILIKIATTADSYYCHNEPILKESGGVRKTYFVKEPLKAILKKIKNRLFNKVVFSGFLFGGVKGKDIKSNAGYLCNLGKPKALLTFDIKEFYPSITKEQIKNIWLQFFKFAEPVADFLAELTTVSNQLPQGACTSNCLANLIFWEHEHNLAKSLFKKNMIYNRFVDDINITINSNYTKHHLSFLNKTIISFLKNYGFSINRKKLKITPQTSPMITNKSVTLNNGYLTAGKLKREAVRKNLFEYLRNYKNNIQNMELTAMYKRLEAQLKFIQYIHPNNTLKKMINILEKHKPAIRI